jgi:hypothetical protein
MENSGSLIKRKNKYPFLAGVYQPRNIRTYVTVRLLPRCAGQCPAEEAWQPGKVEALELKLFSCSA